MRTASEVRLTSNRVGFLCSPRIPTPTEILSNSPRLPISPRARIGALSAIPLIPLIPLNDTSDPGEEERNGAGSRDSESNDVDVDVEVVGSESRSTSKDNGSSGSNVNGFNLPSGETGRRGCATPTGATGPTGAGRMVRADIVPDGDLERARGWGVVSRASAGSRWPRDERRGVLACCAVIC